MIRYQFALSSCELQLEHDALREPPRPLALRHEDYEDCFDFTTLFYDLFWASGEHSAVMVGPPGLNLPADLALQLNAYPSGDRCDASLLGTSPVTHRITGLASATTGLIVRAGSKEFHIAIQPNHCALFRDRRVLTTLSKDNNLEWIKDWALFHKKKHDCDGVLLYDNGSNRYSLDELYACLEPVSKDMTVVVLGWPFKYGVADWRRPLSYGTTDSRYCQQGMLEHARHRFLAEARSVLNADIDELIITGAGSSAFRLAEVSPTGYVEFGGKWVENHLTKNGGARDLPIRHKNYRYLSRRSDGCRPKWVVVPKKVPGEAQWQVHRVLGMIASEVEEAIELRHFKAINTDWKPDEIGPTRLRAATPQLDLADLTLDTVLQEALDEVFTEEDAEVSERGGSVPRSWVAYRLRLRATRYAAGERWSDAIEAMRQASKLMPEHPGFHLYLAQLHRKAGQLAAAEQHLASAKALREQDPLYHFQRGYWQSDAGLVHSRTCFERAIDIDPSFTLAYHALAEQERMMGCPARALAILQKCIANSPKDATSHALLAIELGRRRRGLDALKSCEEAISHDPVNPHFQLQKAKILRQLGRVVEAEQLLHDSIARESLSVALTRRENKWRETITGVERRFYDESSGHKLYAELVQLLVQKGDFSSAEQAARKLLSLSRTVPAGYRLLAQILLLQGENKEAAQILDKGIAIARRELERPRLNSETQNRWDRGGVSRADQLVQLLRLANRQEEAIEVVKRALSAAPESTLLHRQLAGLLAETGDVRGAIEILRAGIARKPEETSLHEKLSLILADHDLGRAIEAAEAALRLEPDNPMLGKRLAKFLMEAGRDGEAEVVLRKVVESEPQDGDLQYRLSQVLQRRQQLEPAFKAAREAIALAPQEPRYHDQLAALLMQQGQDADAEAVLRKALKEGIESGALHYRLSRVLRRIGRRKEALQAASSAVGLEPKKVSFRRHWAGLLREAGREAEAEAVLLAAIEIAPQDAELQFRLSQTLQRQHRLQEAVQAARRATELAPLNDKYRAHLAAMLRQKDQSGEAKTGRRRTLKHRVMKKIAWLGLERLRGVARKIV